jgi:hypothetical protein
MLKGRRFSGITSYGTCFGNMARIHTGAATVDAVMIRSGRDLGSDSNYTFPRHTSFLLESSDLSCLGNFSWTPTRRVFVTNRRIPPG